MHPLHDSAIARPAAAPSDVESHPTPIAAESVHENNPRLTARHAGLAGLSAHILPTSATMIGVCMTVLSIGHLGPGSGLHLVVDKILALDALVFMASALLSFMSMRGHGNASRMEVRAEWLFLTGLGLLALGAVALAFAVR